jgi:hypothetical protein
MWRAFWLIVILFGVPAEAFGQADSSDSQALHALLSEVRALHHDLLSSMARVQKSQILVSRVQAQQANVDRASDRFNTARGRLSDIQDRQKRTTTDIKQLEDSTVSRMPSNSRQILPSSLTPSAHRLCWTADAPLPIRTPMR